MGGIISKKDSSVIDLAEFLDNMYGPFLDGYGSWFIAADDGSGLKVVDTAISIIKREQKHCKSLEDKIVSLEKG